jgi:hypothetical protein
MPSKRPVSTTWRDLPRGVRIPPISTVLSVATMPVLSKIIAGKLSETRKRGERRSASR